MKVKAGDRVIYESYNGKVMQEGNVIRVDANSADVEIQKAFKVHCVPFNKISEILPPLQEPRSTYICPICGESSMPKAWDNHSKGIAKVSVEKGAVNQTYVCPKCNCHVAGETIIPFTPQNPMPRDAFDLIGCLIDDLGREEKTILQALMFAYPRIPILKIFDIYMNSDFIFQANNNDDWELTANLFLDNFVDDNVVDLINKCTLVTKLKNELMKSTPFGYIMTV